jgi:hypothetical protein
MENLEQVLKRYGKRPGSRYWIGKRPDVRDNQLVPEILLQIGYPTSQQRFDVDQLLKPDWQSAAKILSFAATRSLAHGWERGISEGAVTDALTALRDLDGTAVFRANGAWGAWNDHDLKSWIPVSNATFDAGLLGYDQTSAFIFWVEEED